MTSESGFVNSVGIPAARDEGDGGSAELPAPIQQSLTQLGGSIWAAAQNLVQDSLQMLADERDNAVQMAARMSAEAERVREELAAMTKQLAAADSSIAVHKQRLSALESRLYEQEVRIGERNLEVERLAAQNVELTRALAAAVAVSGAST